MGALFLNGKMASGSGEATSADKIDYNNVESELISTNVQSALDELTTMVNSVESTANTAGSKAVALEEKMGLSDISSIGDGTVTGALTSLNSDITNIKNFADGAMLIFNKASNGESSVTFNNVPVIFRSSALFVGNGNGGAYFASCALNSAGSVSNDCSISEGPGLGISQHNNGDGTMNVTITNVSSWGFYYLIFINRSF